MHILGVGTQASLVVVRDASTLLAKPSSVCPWYGSKTIHSHSLPESRCHDNTTTVACGELAAHMMGFWPRTVAALQPAAALKTAVRIPQGEYEEEMRLPFAGGAGGGGHRRRCAVSGALFLLRAMKSDWT